MANRDYVTIVSGLPRSGTSMMMRMIDEGGIPAITDNIRVADADNPKGYYEFEPVKKTKEDASWLKDASGKCVKMVYRLLYDLPAGYQYRVIFMRRNLDEVIQSQEVMLERKGKGTADIPPEKFKEMFKKEIDKCLDWLGAQSHFKFVQIDYNEVVKNAKPAIETLNKFLDGTMDVAAMTNVVDQSLYRQRK